MKGYKGLFAVLLCLSMSLYGCSSSDKQVKIGVSFGVGAAARWSMEQAAMEEQGKTLGVEIDVRMNRGDTEKTQQEDCIELIDSGIDVLVITPRDVNDVSEILNYAKEKKVPVISYARVITEGDIDLFVGYDSERIGQRMGQFLSEMVYKGDYIILKGDEGDHNATLLYNGAMRYIEPIKDDLNVLLDAAVPGWSAEEAKRMVLEAVRANGNKVDAILAPNDKIAGACAEALEEIGIEDYVVITGMDTELDAIKRIVDGKQAMSVYMDLKELAYTAINEAVHIARGENVNINSEFDSGTGKPIDANLITGEIVTKDNLDRILIDSGYFTKEQVYGDE